MDPTIPILAITTGGFTALVSMYLAFGVLSFFMTI